MLEPIIIDWEHLQERKFSTGLYAEAPPSILHWHSPDGRVYEAGAKGEMHVITGFQKSRKTFLLSNLCASAMSGEEFLGYTLTVPSDRNIVYIDTEQPLHRFVKVLRRMLWIGGMDDHTDNFHAFNLRKYDITQRITAIDVILENIKNIDVLIIDGVVDICPDFMSSSDSRITVNHVLRWSDLTQALVFPVVHLNKSIENKQMRGHLGTELQNKADWVSQLTKTTGNPYTTVTCRESRDLPIPMFKFRQDEMGKGVLKSEEQEVEDNEE